MRGQVRGGLIGVAARDDQSLRGARADQNALLWVCGNVDELRASAIVGHSRLKPVEDGLVLRRAGLEAQATAMGHERSRFQEQQRFVRRGGINAPALACFGDRLEVEIRPTAEQGQLEASFTADRAVAIGTRTTALRQDRRDIAEETERLRRAEVAIRGSQQSPLHPETTQ